MLNFFKKIESFCSRMLDRLEGVKISPTSWIITFLCVILVRSFLETFSSHINFFNQNSLSFFLFHSLFFYAFVFLALAIFLHFVTGERIEKITKASLFASILLLLPPILDFLVSGGAGVRNGYYFPEYQASPVDLLVGFLRQGSLSLSLWFDSLSEIKFRTNFGIRLEILILLLAILYYVYLKTKSAWRILVAFVSLRLIVAFIGLFPFLLSKISGISVFHGISFLNPGFSWNYVFFSFYLIFSVILGMVWLWLYDSKILKGLIKSLRSFRAVQIVAIFLFGFLLARPNLFSLTGFDFFLLILAGFALIFYWLSVVLFNDLADFKGDLINDRDRALPSGKLSLAEAKFFAWLFLILSLLAGWAVSYVLFIAILFRAGLGHLYSFNPFRLKKIPFVSTFVLALAAFSTILAGFLFVPGRTVYEFPIKIALLSLAAFTLGFNAKDIKDYEGDKAEGIKTIPVLFGLERGKLIIASLSAVCFLMVPLLFPNYFFPLLAASGLASLAAFVFFIRKRYSEVPLFILYFIYAFSVSVFILK